MAPRGLGVRYGHLGDLTQGAPNGAVKAEIMVPGHQLIPTGTLVSQNRPDRDRREVNGQWRRLAIPFLHAPDHNRARRESLAPDVRSVISVG